MHTLVAPVANLHGTSAAELAAGVLSARIAVRSLTPLIEAACPNGRDYYPHGPDAINVALAEHRRIASAVGGLADDLLWLSDAEWREQAREDHVTGHAVAERPALLPVNHTNGTSRDVLVESAKAVFRAAGAAEEKLKAMLPNARDYADTGQWAAAREQHAARMALVKRVGGYFLSLAASCKAA